jgi:hypothetical protein
MSHFAKRHYQAIAQIIQYLDLSFDSEYDEEGLQEIEAKRQSIAADFASMFNSDNPQFNRALFMQACKPGQNVRARKVA